MVHHFRKSRHEAENKKPIGSNGDQQAEKGGGGEENTAGHGSSNA
jgi:hypothetical protein